MNRQINFIKRNFEVENKIPFSFFFKKRGMSREHELTTNTYQYILTAVNHERQ